MPELILPGQPGETEDHTDTAFPPPIPPHGEFMSEMAGAGENYAPSTEMRRLIVCYTCKHFWLRKSLAYSMSTRPLEQHRREGTADCLFTSPPTPLVGNYVVECNKHEELEQI